MPAIDPQTRPEDMNKALRDAIHGPRAERAQRFHDRRVQVVEDQLRRRYLAADPTATEDDFRRALPELREAMRRRAVVEGGQA